MELVSLEVYNFPYNAKLDDNNRLFLSDHVYNKVILI